MRFSRGLMVPLLALACAQIALPQKYEIAPVFAAKRMTSEPLGSLNDNPEDTDTTFKRSSTGFGLRLTRNTKGYYGHELGYILNRATVRTLIRTGSGDELVETPREGKANIHELSYSFMMYMMPSGEVLRPYISVGAQYFQYNRPKIPEWDLSRTRNFGVNYGGGLKINAAKHLALRLDFRHYLGGKPYDLFFDQVTDSLGRSSTNQGGTIGQFEGSVGFAITF